MDADPRVGAVRVRRAAAAIGVAAGALGVLQWLVHIVPEPIADVGWLFVRPNVALSLILLGVALWPIERPGVGRGLRRAQLAATLAVALVGFLTLVEYVTGVSLGIDTFLGQSPHGVNAVYPGRPAPATAGSLLLLALARLALDAKDARARRSAEVAGAAAGLAAGLTLVGYVFDVRSLTVATPMVKMSVNGACGVLALSIGAIAAVPESRLVAVLATPPPGGTLARRLLPVLLVAVLLFQWLGLIAQKAGLFGPEFGNAVQAVAVIVLVSGLLLWATGVVNQAGVERKRGEEAARASSAYARGLIEASLDPLVTISADGKITDVNAASEAVTGQSRSELIGSDFSDYFTEPERARAGYRAAYAEGSIRDYPLTIRHRDGGTTDVLYNAAVYRDDGGEARGVFAAARDVTALKRAQSALQAERKRFEEVLEGLPVFTLLLTPDFHVRYANRRFREIFGEVGGRHCYEALFRLTEPCPHCQSFVCLQTHKPHRWEWESAEGRSYQIHDRPFVDVDGAELVLEMGVDVTERKLAEAELKQREYELREAQRIAHVGGWSLAGEAGELIWSEEAARVFGLDPGLPAPDYEELHRIMTEDSWARIEDGLTRVFREGVPYEIEVQAKKPDGTAGWLLARGEAVRGPDGKVVGARGTVLDINERKQAELELARLNAYNRGLIEASLDPVVTISAEGKITDVNAATEIVTGVGRAALIGSDFSDYFTEPEKARAGYQAVFSQGLVRDYPLTIRHQSGIETHVLYNATVYRGAKGEVVGVFAAARDVTERERSEQEIRRLNRLYGVLSRTGQSMVRVQSRQGLFDEACRIAVEVGGFRLAWVGELDEATHLIRPVAVHGHPADYVALARISADDVPEGRGPTGAAYREGRAVVCRDIEREPQMAPWRAEALAAGFRSSASFPLRSGNAIRAAFTVYSGEVGWFGDEEMQLLNELTASISYAIEALEHEERRRRAEEEVRALNETLERRVAERTAELAAANTELQAFAYSVSHDLRAPLRSINGFSQALVEDDADRLDEIGRDHLRRIQAATQRMGAMIDDLLKLSRVTRSEMRREGVDLSALAAEVVAELRREAPARRVDVAIEPGLTARGDRSLTRIVLENLLANAWKFTAPRDGARIEVGRCALDGRSAFFVRDNGVGFDARYVERLFAPFQRLHAAVDFEGTGIGLATVQRIVQRHGGQIVAAGETGKGAQFTFTLE